jgi:hypothetical protein
MEILEVRKEHAGGIELHRDRYFEQGPESIFFGRTQTGARANPSEEIAPRP